MGNHPLSSDRTWQKLQCNHYEIDASSQENDSNKRHGTASTASTAKTARSRLVRSHASTTDEIIHSKENPSFVFLQGQMGPLKCLFYKKYIDRVLLDTIP